MRSEQAPLHQCAVTVQGHGGPSFIMLMGISQPLWKAASFPGCREWWRFDPANVEMR